MARKQQVTLYLDREIYERLKELLAPKPVSPEVENLMVKMIEEIEGADYRPEETVDYEDLEKQHGRIVKEIKRLERLLKDEYDKLRRVTLRCKLSEETLELTPEIVKCILDTYEGNPANAHLYINLIELIKKRREIERQLNEIRLQQL